MTGRDLLLEMLTYRRPAGSRTESKFINRFLVPLGARRDPFGNYVLRVGDSRVAWLSHTDTVHYDGGRQEVYVSEKGVAGLAKPRKWDCLGADDTTGVWLMAEMVRARVPGLYIFHYGEEKGCIGSGAIARHTPELLLGVNYAVSLDRRDFDSVVTHQLGRRTASDDFAYSMADILDLGYEPDPGGVFTDSESYADIVPECTNLSVGYWSQHGPNEKQDVDFALMLRDELCTFDESRLVCARDPNDFGAWYDDSDDTPDPNDPDDWEDLDDLGDDSWVDRVDWWDTAAGPRRLALPRPGDTDPRYQ